MNVVMGEWLDTNLADVMLENRCSFSIYTPSEGQKTSFPLVKYRLLTDDKAVAEYVNERIPMDEDSDGAPDDASDNVVLLADGYSNFAGMIDEIIRKYPDRALYADVYLRGDEDCFDELIYFDVMGYPWLNRYLSDNRSLSTAGPRHTDKREIALAKKCLLRRFFCMPKICVIFTRSFKLSC